MLSIINPSPNFYKAAAIIIRDRKLLVTREKGKEYLIAPGGKIETGESAKQAVVRELKEEVNVDCQLKDLKLFGVFQAPAADQPGKWVKMEVFVVDHWSGEPTPSHGDEEIEEIKWLNSKNKNGLKIGSIIEHEVMPRLKDQNLID